jgi:non-heme chloroperoxidase
MLTAGKSFGATREPNHYWHGAGGLKLAGDSWGDPHSPLVVLLHGGGQTRHAWKETGAILGACGYHAVAYDARGHGDSDWSDDAWYGVDPMVIDLNCVLAAYRMQPVALVGASMGGGVSLVAVGEGHVDAAALVLVDIAPRMEMEGIDKIHAFMNRSPEGFDSLEEAAQAVRDYQPHRKRSINLETLAKNLRLAPNGKYRWHWDPRSQIARERIADRQERFRNSARGLAVPTLLIRGAMSDVLTEEGVRDFKELCPQSEYFCVSSAAHMVAGDRNDIFGTAVVEFLSRVFSPTRRASRS